MTSFAYNYQNLFVSRMSDSSQKKLFTWQLSKNNSLPQSILGTWSQMIGQWKVLVLVTWQYLETRGIPVKQCYTNRLQMQYADNASATK